MSGAASQKVGALKPAIGRKRFRTERTRERTKCDNCPGKSRDGQYIPWYGRKLYLCPRCLVAARNVMKEAGHEV